ncbi:MAG: hypothetical protein AMJ46_02235 [Latescibacteria bacterium DG_63]|nr:MAG: hypothetical protein AMJ46_02235 [Latescibacteria bacterium DG_63]
MSTGRGGPLARKLWTLLAEEEITGAENAMKQRKQSARTLSDKGPGTESRSPGPSGRGWLILAGVSLVMFVSPLPAAAFDEHKTAIRALDATQENGDSVRGGGLVESYGWPGDSLLSGYIAEALSRHPRISGSEALVRAEEARRANASAWMNPKIILALMNAPTDFNLNVDPMTQTQIGFVQTVPWPGKLSSSRRAAEERVNSGTNALEATRWKVRTLVARAYFRLAGLTSERDALREARTLADQTLKVTGIMLSSGMESQANFFQAEVEKARITRQLLLMEGEIEKARAALAYALGRESPDGIKNPELSLDLTSPFELSQITAYLEEAPALKVLKSDSLASHFDLKRSRLEYFPDLTIGARYGMRGKIPQDLPSESGASGWTRLDSRVSLELSFAIPLWPGGNQRAQVEASKARLEKAKADLAEERIRLSAELRSMYFETRSKAEQFLITRDSILVQAENAYRSAVPSYRAGELSWLSLNRIRITLSMVHMELAVLAADFFAKKAELEEAVGRILL